MLVDQVVFFGVPLVAFGIIAGLGLTDEKGDPTGFGLVIFIPACGFALAVGIWNRILRDGKTGQSLGRQLTGTRLIGLATGAPIGLGKVLLRQLCHLLDNLPCVCLPLGFLWPLWDERRQTFADKIVGSIVVREGNQMLREGQMAVDLHEVPITKVTLTGRELTFPRTCCCCGRPAEREAALSAEKATFVVVGTIRRTLTVSVPCCEFCGPHVEWANRGGFWRLIPMAIPALLGSMLVSGCLITLPFVVILGTVGVSSETSMASYPYILGGGTVLVVLAWLAWEARKRPKETPGPRHVCGHGAAYIKRFDADTTTLNFLNANYAQEVVRMNPAKVVKVESSTAAKEA